ncbi:hypothetical protein V5N11_001553 [Cardamine amara subsp. amara]|uniref:Transposase MuDR plant domain-containing protein n=1 Tax=Cardamine amara subsp. amara TaxID=228776 RepID=A0ABD0ZWB7_CARAN
MCSTNDAFDHVVLLNGGEQMKCELKKEEFGIDGYGPVDTYEWTNKCGGNLSNGGVPRKLEEINDEEFDIPPMFDDTIYKRDEILDLDYEDESGIYVGKMYACKTDCQIALAIHAIKKRFHFKQTKTTRNSFVLTCSDTKCFWRIMARETKNHGYYEIGKVEPEHTCSIETRSKCMEKATSRVIASLYKSKYINQNKGPNAVDMQ